MRTLEEIKKDMELVDNEIHKLKTQWSKLSEEKRERIFFDFCEKNGLKAGDIVETTRYGTFQIVCVDRNWGDWILCHKIKKNGEPYASTTTQSQGIFEGCKVIGHQDV
jgi:hypothetical protein